MKKNHFAARGKLWIAALSLAAMTTASTVPAAEKDPLRPDVQQQIRKTLQTRVELLDRLTVYSEKQYKQGSLDGNAVLQAQTDLYVAKLLMMKAEAGLPPEPGAACAAVRLYAAEFAGTDMRRHFSGGTLSLSLLLHAQLKTNSAQLKYWNELRKCKHPEGMEKVRRKFPPFNPERRLEDGLLRELLNAEIQSQ